jgi:hypothetical protein
LRAEAVPPTTCRTPYVPAEKPPVRGIAACGVPNLRVRAQVAPQASRGFYLTRPNRDHSEKHRAPPLRRWCMTRLRRDVVDWNEAT